MHQASVRESERARAQADVTHSGHTASSPAGGRPCASPDSVFRTSLLAGGPGAGGRVCSSGVGAVAASRAELDTELHPVGKRFVTS